MHKIYSASDLARFAETCLDDALRPLLQAKAELLAEYDDLATFVIVEPDDSLDTWPESELVEVFDGWTVVTIIVSDDGEGIILFVPSSVELGL